GMDHQPLCHPERSASEIHLPPQSLARKSKDPENVSFAMPPQGILTRAPICAGYGRRGFSSRDRQSPVATHSHSSHGPGTRWGRTVNRYRTRIELPMAVSFRDSAAGSFDFALYLHAKD